MRKQTFSASAGQHNSRCSSVILAINVFSVVVEGAADVVAMVHKFCICFSSCSCRATSSLLQLLLPFAAMAVPEGEAEEEKAACMRISIESDESMFLQAECAMMVVYIST